MRPAHRRWLLAAVVGAVPLGAQRPDSAGITLTLRTQQRAEPGGAPPASTVTVRALGAMARVDGTDGGLPVVLQRMAGAGGYLLLQVAPEGVLYTVVNTQRREALRVRASELAAMGDVPAGARIVLDSMTVSSRLLPPPTRLAGQPVRRAAVDEVRVYTARTPQGATPFRIMMRDTVALAATASMPRGAAAAMALLVQSSPLGLLLPTGGSTVVQGQRPVGVPLAVVSATTLGSDGRAQRLHRTVSVTALVRGALDPSLFVVPAGIRVSDAGVLLGKPAPRQ